MGTSVMVTSGKGGTGKTALTAGVASCLAALGRRVLCIDVDVGLRNLDIALGMSDRAVIDFSDVMEHRCPLLTAAAEHPQIRGLFLLTAPLSLINLDLKGFRDVIDEARDYYDFIFLDSPAGLGDGFQLAMYAADRAIVVSATEPAALRDAQRVVTQLSQLETIHLVVNRVRPRLLRRQNTTIDDAMDTAGLPLLGLVPEDPKVVLAATEGRPLAQLGARRGAVRAYENIARRLTGQLVPLMGLR